MRLLLSAVVIVLGMAAGGVGDRDGDGVADADDCAPNDSSVWSAPGEVTDLTLDRVSSVSTLTWTPPGDLGGDPAAVTYEVLRTSNAADLESLLGCVEFGGTDALAADPRIPSSGEVAFYVVRAASCEPGAAGDDSSGVEREVGPFATVANLNDSGPGSLRHAVADATPGDLICIAEHGTISLAGIPIVVDKTLTLRGPGRESLTIDGNGASTVLELTADSCRVDDLAITGGAAGVAALDAQSAESSRVHACRVSENAGDGASVVGTMTSIEAVGNGGHGVILEGTIADSQALDNFESGIWAAGHIHGLLIDGNGAGHSPAGVLTRGNLVISESTISNNPIGVYAPTNSGGLATIESSTIVDNITGVASYGFQHDVAITRTTISGNSYRGVTTYYGGDSSIESSTIVGNGVGVYSYGYALTIRNSVLAWNVENCSTYYLAEDPLSLGHNISSDATCSFTADGDRTSTDPLLEPLGANGGPTLTYGLDPASPAIDAGSCPTEEVDQRGLSRPVDFPAIADEDDACDVGAVERQLGASG